MKKKYVLIISLVCYAVFGYLISYGSCEVASCRVDDQGSILSCMEFASSKPIPAPLEKSCTMGGSKGNIWTKNPCPRTGTIGYCEVPRKDAITQVVYCYKRQGIPDKQKLEFCRQACKGRFAMY